MAISLAELSPVAAQLAKTGRAATGPLAVLQERIYIWRGDITTLQVDAIANAANSTLLGGGGVDGAIHAAAGPALVEECRTLNGAATGEAKITKGYGLPAAHVIHTVGPIYGRHSPEENARLLAACYTNCLERARETGCGSVAFPSISTGVYGHPKPEAARIATTTVLEWLGRNESAIKVVFCVFSAADEQIYERTL